MNSWYFLVLYIQWWIFDVTETSPTKGNKSEEIDSVVRFSPHKLAQLNFFPTTLVVHPNLWFFRGCCSLRSHSESLTKDLIKRRAWRNKAFRACERCFNSWIFRSALFTGPTVSGSAVSSGRTHIPTMQKRTWHSRRTAHIYLIILKQGPRTMPRKCPKFYGKNLVMPFKWLRRKALWKCRESDAFAHLPPVFGGHILIRTRGFGENRSHWYLTLGISVIIGLRSPFVNGTAENNSLLWQSNRSSSSHCAEGLLLAFL